MITSGYSVLSAKLGTVGKRLFAYPPIMPIQRVQTIERFAHATELNGGKDLSLPI